MKRDMLEGIEAVLFDLDGTLVDSMWMWERIDFEFLTARGLDMPENLKYEIEGISFAQTADYFIKRFNLLDTPEELMKIWNDMAYDKYCKEVPLKPGAKEFLDDLKARGIKTAIGTSNSYELTKACLRAHGILEDIDYILTSDEVPNGKPEPDIFLMCAEHFDIKPENCIVFEDIPNGMIAAIRAGMKVCGVEDEFSLEMTERKKELSDYYITSYEQIKNGSYEDTK